MTELLAGLGFLVISAACLALRFSMGRRETALQSAVKEYADAEIIAYDDSSRLTEAVVRFTVDGIERKSRSSLIDRFQYPIGTKVKVSFRRDRFTVPGVLGYCADIISPDIDARSRQTGQRLRQAFLVLGLLFLGLALAFSLAGLRLLIIHR